MNDKINNINICCSGCKKELKIEELKGENKKVCPYCGYGLFMIFEGEKVDMVHLIEIKNLNKLQLKILNYIILQINNTGFAPSIEEIKQNLHLNSVSTVYYHINKLKEKGYITFKKGSTHTIKLMPKVISDETKLLSEVQIKLLRFIHEKIKKEKKSPTTKEMQELLGFSSTATLSYHLDKLIKYGLISKIKYQHRALQITKKGEMFLEMLKKQEN